MARVGRGARSLHRRVHVEGAVRVVSGQPGACPIVPDGAGPIAPRPSDRHRPVPLRPVPSSTTTSSWRRSTTTSAAAPQNDGLILKVVPDDIMRGLELRKGTIDLVVNDLAPGHRPSARTRRSGCRSSQSPGDGLSVHRPEPARSDSARTCASARRSATPSIARRSSSICAADWPRRPPGILPPVVVGVRAGRVHVHVRSGTGTRAARRGRAIPIPTATVPPPRFSSR